MNNIDLDFSIDKYFEKLDNSIKIILLRKEKEILTYDILDTEKSKKNKLIFLKQKQYQMKIGEIWQEVLGSYKDYLNLKNRTFFWFRHIISYKKSSYRIKK